jgi:hypothetical protein
MLLNINKSIQAWIIDDDRYILSVKGKKCQPKDGVCSSIKLQQLISVHHVE